MRHASAGDREDWDGDGTQRNVSTGSYAVSVHDSSTEIFDIGDDFLTLFTHS